MEEAIWSAVSYLNDVFSSVESIFRKLCINIGTLGRKMYCDGDDQQQKNASCNSVAISKKMQKSHAQGRRYRQSWGPLQ